MFLMCIFFISKIRSFVHWLLFTVFHRIICVHFLVVLFPYCWEFPAWKVWRIYSSVGKLHDSPRGSVRSRSSPWSPEAPGDTWVSSRPRVRCSGSSRPLPGWGHAGPGPWSSSLHCARPPWCGGDTLPTDCLLSTTTGGNKVPLSATIKLPMLDWTIMK